MQAKTDKIAETSKTSWTTNKHRQDRNDEDQPFTRNPYQGRGPKPQRRPKVYIPWQHNHYKWWDGGGCNFKN